MSHYEKIIGTMGMVLAAVFVSCFVADCAGGGRVSPLWGLLGPIGWIIAWLDGTQRREEESPDAEGPTGHRRE